MAYLIRDTPNRQIIIFETASIDGFLEDSPIEIRGTAGLLGWLADVASNAGCNVLNGATPHKDANDWTLAGATAADLQAAMNGDALAFRS